ncbi:MAG: pyridoxal phosphate-dependent aminotransferase [Clostridiales Family XIII bacterium]|jgi:cystathionine beta-lyase|nr:pyridoxal phosphate-dependent aminotransferase [Clostridiales Family XIII bacterium]
MSKYEFDEIINRYNTDSLKYDCASLKGMPDGILPMWVADMDFKTADPVSAALRKASDHGIFGYTVPGASYYDSVRSWWRERHGYEFDAQSVVVLPGVVFALAQTVRAFTKPGDAVLIQRPVYYPFTDVIESNGRRLVNNPLVLGEDGKYRIDFDDFEQRLAEDKPKMFILCSPHNPVGRVWTRGELERMGDLCLSYGCLVISDEIHADFIYRTAEDGAVGLTQNTADETQTHTDSICRTAAGESKPAAGAARKHTVFSTIKDDFRANSVVCTSPSKSFNLAGLQLSNIVIEDPELRTRYREEINASGYSQPSVVGVAACRAAYEEGGPWFDELAAYIEGNLAALRSRLAGETPFANPGTTSFAPTTSRSRADGGIPGVRLIEPEGTYLPWLDFRGTGLAQDEADDLLINKAGIWLDSGTMFGPEGEGFQRINIACPRSILTNALDRIASAVIK